MRIRKIWSIVLAAALSAALVFPASVFAEEAGNEGQEIVQEMEETGNDEETGDEETGDEETGNIETITGDEQTETSETEVAEEDILPTIGDATVTASSEGYISVPITVGSGKYKASVVKMEMIDPNTGLLVVYDGQDAGYHVEITDDMLSDGIWVFAMFDESSEVESGKAGDYPVRVTFLNENGETVCTDEDSIKVHMEEDWAVARAIDDELKWDGYSDLVFRFDPGKGLGALTGEILNSNGLETTSFGAHSMGKHYTLEKDKDFELDLKGGTFTIKGEYLRKLAAEDETFGDAEYYYTNMIILRMECDFQPAYLEWTFTYDKNAAQQGGQDSGNGNGNVSPAEVELSDENTSIPADEMASLVEQNRDRDVVIRTSNGVEFRFAKGTMKLVEGKDSYDFGTTLIFDRADSGLDGIADDEFVFRINFCWG